MIKLRLIEEDFLQEIEVKVKGKGRSVIFKKTKDKIFIIVPLAT